MLRVAAANALTAPLLVAAFATLAGRCAVTMNSLLNATRPAFLATGEKHIPQIATKEKHVPGRTTAPEARTQKGQCFATIPREALPEARAQKAGEHNTATETTRVTTFNTIECGILATPRDRRQNDSGACH